MRPGDPYDRNEQFDAGGSSSLNPDETFSRLRSSEHNPQGGFFNPLGDQKTPDGQAGSAPESQGSNGSRANSPSEIRDNEEAAGGDGSGQNQGAAAGAGLYKADGDEPKGRLGQARAKLGSAKNRVGKALSNKWLWGLGVGAGGSVILLAALLIMLASMKIPHFVEHVTAYQFARVTRQMVQNSDNILAEKMGIDAATDSNWSKIKQRYYDSRAGKSVTKVRTTYDKVANKFFPGVIARNYEQQEHFKPLYSPTSISGRQRLTAVKVDNQIYRIEAPRGFTKYVPGVQFMYDLENARSLRPYLRTSLRVDNIGPITSWKVMKAERQRLGIGRVAWHIARYSADFDKNLLAQRREAHAAIAKEEAKQAKTKLLTQAAEEGKKQLDETVNDDRLLRQVIDNDGVDPKTVAKVGEVLNDSNSFLRGFVGAVSSVYAVSFPVCMIYDSSLQNSSEAMVAQENNVKRTYFYMASASAQQRDGYQADARPISAIDHQLGNNLASSNAERRAAGGTGYTGDYPSVQASASGDFTIFDDFPDAAEEVVEGIAERVCPAVTDIYVGLALGVASFGVCLTGVGCLGKKAAEEGAKTAMGKVTGKILEKVASRQADKGRALGGILENGVKSGIKTGAVIAGSTFLAQGIVYNNMQAEHNGLQSDNDFANDIDNGGLLASNTIMKKQFYGRPLTDKEAASTKQSDQLFLAEKMESQSPFDRYANIRSPDSLLTRVGIMVGGYQSGSTIATSIAKLGSSVLNPLRSLGSLFSSTFPKVSAAASPHTSRDSNYGNILWGYSSDEQNLIKNDPSYQSMLSNQLILDESGKEEEIATKYGPCYEKEDGELLADGLIVRDENGDVVRNKGLCAPDNLSFDSPDPLAANVSPDSPNRRDLIFRWRLAQGYTNTIDQLIDSQEITKS